MSDEAGEGREAGAAREERSAAEVIRSHLGGPIVAVGAEAEAEGPRPDDRWAHRRGEPRLLALVWSLYLFALTVAALWPMVVSGNASVEAYRPAVRLMLAMTAFGVVVLWPMTRMSQSAPSSRALVWAMRDVGVIVLPLQAVVWPQWLLARWPVEVVGSLSVMLLAWSVLIGGLLAAAWTGGTDERGRVRGAVIWTGVCVALAGLAPGLAALFGPLPVGGGIAAGDQGTSGAGWVVWMLSPVSSVFELSLDRPSSGLSAAVSAGHWWMIGAVGAVGACVWCWAAVRSGMTRGNGGGGVEAPGQALKTDEGVWS